MPKTILFPRQRFFAEQFPFHISRVVHRPVEIDRNVLHRREFWKIAYVLSGNANFIVNGKCFPIHKGNVLISHPDSYTTVDITSENLIIFNVLFLPELLEPELAKLRGHFGFFSILNPKEPEFTELYVIDKQRSLLSIILDLQHEFKRRETNFEIMIRMRLVELVVAIARNSIRGFRAPSDEYVVRYIDQWIERGFGEKRDLDALAGETGIRKDRLCLVYRRGTGMTIMDALRRRRIVEACRLLAETDLSINEVCLQAGFVDLSHFYHVFRRLRRMTPLEYRDREAGK